MSRYTSMPGTPPGMNAMMNPSLNQKALIPKNSASPPQTPAIMLLLRERRRDLFCCVVIFTLLSFLIPNFLMIFKLNSNFQFSYAGQICIQSSASILFTQVSRKSSRIYAFRTYCSNQASVFSQASFAASGLKREPVSL